MPPKTAAAPSGVLSQFTGNAGWGIIVGLATIVVPLLLNRVFFVLPIIGLIIGVYAVVRKQAIGGVLAVALNVIGGIITIVALRGG